jgi:hypothetical protein
VTVFLRLLEAGDKAEALRARIATLDEPGGISVHVVDAESFRLVPKAPFAYWVSDRVRRMFRELPPLEGEERHATKGVATTDDPRFVRLWFELGQNGNCTRSWPPLCKGGTYSPYYVDVYLSLKWIGEGRELKAFLDHKIGAPGQWSRWINAVDYYGRPGLTWPLRTTSPLSLRVLPSGCIFSHKGPSLFVGGPDESESLLVLLALANSATFKAMVALHLGAAEGAARSYEVGVLQRTPIPAELQRSSDLVACARELWRLRRQPSESDPSSRAFVLPQLLHLPGPSLETRTSKIFIDCDLRESKETNLQDEIDRKIAFLYRLSGTDSHTLLSGPGQRLGEAAPVAVPGDEEDASDEDDGRTTPPPIAAKALVADLVAWAAGVTIGRFDIRLATGERAAPTEPEPFDPLPAVAPGVLVDGNGQLAHATPSGYPIELPASGLLVDDRGHPADLVERVERVLALVEQAQLGGASTCAASARWALEAATVLDPKTADLRSWIRKELFVHHRKQHTRKPRTAPILWQLSSPNGSYSLWLNYHRASAETLLAALRDFVRPKLEHERHELERRRERVGEDPTRQVRGAIEAQEDLVAELRDFERELERVRPLFDPQFDDGVPINAAPLWRLFGHDRAWQDDCRKTWERLQNRELDWSHLAMRLWPEHVVPKCAEDRSLAIAHDLEDTLWEERPAQGKRGKPTWAPRNLPAAELQRLVAARTSPAVKAALAVVSSSGSANGSAKQRKHPRRPKGAR